MLYTTKIGYLESDRKLRIKKSYKLFGKINTQIRDSLRMKDFEKEKYPVITLFTDFGIKDVLSGAMKGVILCICLEVKIVDFLMTC